MRLLPDEITRITEGIDVHLSGEAKKETKLFLFGSRTKDTARGGDIDLLLIVKDPLLKQALQGQKHVLLAAIKEKNLDQRIDLKIATEQECASDAFLKIICSDAILLKAWK